MILGYRVVNRGPFRGINLFVGRDWCLPIESLGTDCFNAFDESVARLRADPQATRLFVPGHPRTNELNVFHTATLAALRALPERYRAGASLYTLAVSRAESGRIILNLPPWAMLMSEDDGGDLHLHSTALTSDSATGSGAGSGSGSGPGWQQLQLWSSETRLHLGLFAAQPARTLSGSGAGARFVRLATLIEARQRGHETLSLALKLEG